jgi:hypothetical protein
VAFSYALPFAGQFVRAISGWQHASISKELDGSYEISDILAATLLSLDVTLELHPLHNSPH